MVAALVCAINAVAADFGSRGGPAPANIDRMATLLRNDSYDLELLISFGTSKGGSAGHLALSFRDGARGDDLVYSANFYADRRPEHDSGFYTADLMAAIPKMEYLFKTVSSLGETASFGLDFGEVYKRSVIGVRVYGVPSEQKQALVSYFNRINEDFRNRVVDTEYHDGEVKYDYMHLNCAKTIGSAFRFGAGYSELELSRPRKFSITRLAAVANANIPTEMAMKLIAEWDRRGYGMDVVLYKKYGSSNYIDPHEEEKVAFKDLPNRFPSVKSRDFNRNEGAYQDFDNLYAMYLLYNMGKYSVRVNEQTQLLEIEKYKRPMAFREASTLATRSAKSDSKNYRRHLRFLPKGVRVGEPPDNTHLYEFNENDSKSVPP